MAAVESGNVFRQAQESTRLLIQGSYVEAEAPLRAALETALAQKNAETFTIEMRLAESLIGQGKFIEAESFAHKAVLGFKRFGCDDEDLLDSHVLVAESLLGQRKYMETVEVIEGILQGLESNMRRGPEHPTTLKCKCLLAQAMKNQCKVAEAIAIAKQTRDCMDEVLVKADGLEKMGSRKLNPFERHTFQKVDAMLVKVLGQENLKPRKMSTIETAETGSTREPDTDCDLDSRLPSKESLPSRQISSEP